MSDTTTTTAAADRPGLQTRHWRAGGARKGDTVAVLSAGFTHGKEGIVTNIAEDGLTPIRVEGGYWRSWFADDQLVVLKRAGARYSYRDYRIARLWFGLGTAATIVAALLGRGVLA